LNPAGRLLPSAVKERLKTRRFGRRIYYYPQTDSTNRVALELARLGESEGTLVVTDFQTEGRGRQDHTWSSAAGKDLLFTLVLRPEQSPRFNLPITLVFSSAVSGVLSDSMGQELGVKWPNDIIAPRGKIGGILAEGSAVPGHPSFVVVGTGINVNSDETNFPAELQGLVASCRTLTGRSWDRAAVLADVLEAMEARYDRFRRDGFPAVRAQYEQALTTTGRLVSIEREGVRLTGTVDGVNDDGALRLSPTGGGEPLVVYNEEVRLEP